MSALLCFMAALSLAVGLFRITSKGFPLVANSAKTATAKVVLTAALRERSADTAEDSAISSDSEVKFWVGGGI